MGVVWASLRVGAWRDINREARDLQSVREKSLPDKCAGRPFEHDLFSYGAHALVCVNDACERKPAARQ
jgi:hypothetical protein